MTPTTVSREFAIEFEGRGIGWDELVPVLAEAAGASAIEEVVLDRLVTRELLARGMAVRSADVDRERNLLAEELRSSSGELADAAFTRLRDRRGLGDVRMRSLLERNAGLRMLVADRVSVSESDIETAHAIAHGPRIRVRYLVAPSLIEASAIRERIEAAPDRTVSFATEAVNNSIDISGGRGGIVDPISLADPRWPRAIRERLSTLNMGEVSEPLVVDGGFALVMPEGLVPGDGVAHGGVRQSLERRLRLARERAAMEQLAARLLSGARFEILDPQLAWSWERRRNR